MIKRLRLSRMPESPEEGKLILTGFFDHDGHDPVQSYLVYPAQAAKSA